ncbi:MAG: DUF4384 domain-containing protein [Rhodopirellula sp.]|nr:DUF4384 domain-containing protein [Rhodopirellula sp.]
MRRFYPALILAVLALLPASSSAEHYALLVGIDDYPRLRNRNLGGAANDVERLSHVLLREFSFPQQNVSILRNQQATLFAIRQAFQQLADRVQPGDTVVFHYSGHGTLLVDDNGDEQDGQDEALCPHDFAENGAQALRDDELDQMLAKLGPVHIAVLLDCCHSGTATKSVNRRLRSRYVPALQQAKSLFAGTKSLTASPSGGEIGSAVGGQQRVVFSACTAAQESVELDVSFEPDLREPLATGLLTYFLVEGLRGPADTNDDGVISYGEAFAHARRQIDAQFNADQVDETARQTPVLDCPDSRWADGPVFGVARKQPLYAHVEPMQADRAMLDLGAVHGLKPRQVLGIYAAPPTGTRLEQPLGQLEIDRLDIRSAEAKAVSGVAPRKGVVVVPLVDPADDSDVLLLIERVGSSGPVEDAAADAICQQVSRLAAELDRVRLSDRDGYDLRITVAPGGTTAGRVEISVTATELNGTRHGPRQWFHPGSVAQQIVAWIGDLAGGRQTRMSLATLTNPAPGFGLQAVVDRRPAGGANLAEYRVGDSLKFGLKASADCWYYIVAVDPSDQARLWCPQPNQQHFAPAGRKLLHPGPGELFRVAGPAGVYVVKLLAVREPLPSTAFHDGIPRPQALQSMPPSQWAESSVTFRVVP